MRKLLLFFCLICIVQFAQGQTTNNAKSMIPDKVDPYMLQPQYDMSKLKDLIPANAAASSSVQRARIGAPMNSSKVLRRAGDAPVDTVNYFGVAESYYKNYAFDYNGGEILTYNVGVAVDGTKVTFKNMFNLYDATAYQPDEEYTVSGTYDATAKTITIPTSTVFANATVVGKIYNYYTGVLVSGTVDEKGKLAPEDNLVFKVSDDMKTISTNQAFGVAMYSPDGTQSYGQRRFYRSYQINVPEAGSKLISFTKSIAYGNSFPSYSVDKTFTVVNTGNDATDYAIDMESDDNSFTASPATGTIAGKTTADITVTFNAAKTGDYEGIATINYENGSADGDPILVQLSGSVVPYPDYSPVVKNGQMSFTTNLEYPFVLDTLANNQIVAASNTKGNANASSMLSVKVNVPEGKLGKFSWKGVSNNSSAFYYNAGGVFVDDNKFSAFTGANENMSGMTELAPGDHVIKFQYDGYYYSGLPENRLYVYDLDFETETLAADSALLENTTYDFGNFIVTSDSPASAAGTIKIMNKGKNDLKVVSVSSDNSAFSIDAKADPAATLKELNVPIAFDATQAGSYVATYTIVTTAGTFRVFAQALVRDMPDFSKIVKEGKDLFTFTTDPANPFIVDGNMAYNANAQVVDKTQTISSFTASFTVPEGKMGYISWKGHSYGEPIVNNNYYLVDYSIFEVHHPMSTGDLPVYGDADASSDVVFADDFWKPYLTCIPGDHYIKFEYCQTGDSTYAGKDRLEISDLSLVIKDFKEHGAELKTTEAVFDSTYVGDNRYTTATVTLHNTGSKYLKVTDIPAVEPFYGVEPKDSVAFDQDMNITLWFYPTAPGEYSDSLTINTNAGSFKVAVKGVAKSSDGILLIGDFEDDAQGWQTYDADKDGEGWNLGYNLFGGDFPQYCHSGKELLGSASYSYNNGDITPDNWTFSPSVTIPNDGATLTWYVAPQSKKRALENYDVYIAESIATDGLSSLTSSFNETLDSTAVDTWRTHRIDLTPWAGKTIYVCFRHHDCTGQWLLKLDDVFVWTKAATPDAINGITEGSDKVARQEFYNLSGVRTQGLSKGVNIVKTYYNDGTMKSVKVLKR
jgi:hypothetical protein